MRTIRLPLRSGFLALMVLMLTAFTTFAQHYPIEGVWMDPSGKSKLQIYKNANGTYSGKLIWVQQSPKSQHDRLDHRNPDPAKRSRPLLGMVLLSGLKYDSNNDYKGGEIYDPSSGKTYSCNATVNTPQKLNMRGFVGISLIGKSITWTRSN